MIFHRIESKGISHYSYLIGDGGKALVIDPRRDTGVYLKMAQRKGFQIAHILETHRNEDYVVGSTELAECTGAEVWHADSQWDYHYGQPVEDGQEWQVGNLMLQALHTPGHTPGSMSYVLHTDQHTPWMAFTGDTLFAGEVGRTDLLGSDNIHKMTTMLYESIVNKLLPLGDGVILCPAHGSGSACGSAISQRAWTTIGLERDVNPRLKYHSREEFVANVAVELERPPYFKEMEKANLISHEQRGIPEPRPLSPAEFAELAHNVVILDTRLQGFAPAHIPGSISIWSDGVPGFAGWFLPYDRHILLVNETDDTLPAVKSLIRLGYDQIDGYLAGGIRAWHQAGYDTAAINTITVPKLCQRLDASEDAWILDVRSQGELEHDGTIPGAHHIHITQLPKHINEVPKNVPVFIFCGSGLRSMIAASLLQREGWQNMTVVLGGFTAWKSVACPIRLASEEHTAKTG